MPKEPVSLMLLERILKTASDSERAPHTSLEKQIAAFRAIRVNAELLLDMAREKSVRRVPIPRELCEPRPELPPIWVVPQTDSFRKSLAKGQADWQRSVAANNPDSVCAHGVPIGMECEQCLAE